MALSGKLEAAAEGVMAEGFIVLMVCVPEGLIPGSFVESMIAGGMWMNEGYPDDASARR